tara:strand:- start:1504 stop:2106 length:603 start_codon:yes stop_codon:yes gene_type:complete
MPRSRKLNLNSLLKKYNFKGSKSLQKAAYSTAVKKVDKIKKEALVELNKHEVTREIEAGPNAMGSNLLGGRGSLFGFLGFDRNSQPVEILRSAFDIMFTVNKNQGTLKKVNERRFTLEYQVHNVPTITEIYGITPLSWTTKSWVKGIERGISNSSNTIFKDTENSRSGVAIQSKQKINFIKFNPTPYVSTILDNARKKFR